MKIMTEQAIILAALDARSRAYAPYSHFYVGAALLCKDGSIFCGVNIENASYPAGICAERSAFCAALSAGQRQFSALAIAGGKEDPPETDCPPCGICRQFISEFCGADFPILLVRSEKDYRRYTLGELLPEHFTLSPTGDQK